MEIAEGLEVMHKWPKSVSFAQDENIRTSFSATIELDTSNKDAVVDTTEKGTRMPQTPM